MKARTKKALVLVRDQCAEVGVQYRIPCETDDGNLAILTKDGETVIIHRGAR